MDTLRTLSGTDFGTLQSGTDNKVHVPSNLDGCDQKGDFFLCYEIKNPGEQVSIGQEIMLKALARCQRHTVLIVHCTGERTAINATRFVPVTYERIYPNGMITMPVPCNLTQFIELRNTWFKAATGGNDNLMRFCFPTTEGDWLREMAEKVAGGKI
jgi:hypothetical protein